MFVFFFQEPLQRDGEPPADPEPLEGRPEPGGSLPGGGRRRLVQEGEALQREYTQPTHPAPASPSAAARACDGLTSADLR